ncbi:MAG: hypothetical protein HYW48_01720 [Deltaproteobacteria bacterium]|nr:hypothetical protein [Deltaproteobacteria bacterium]
MKDIETENTSKSPDNLVPLFKKTDAGEKREEANSLGNAMERNKRIQERLEKERKRANQWVLRSYRLKK